MKANKVKYSIIANNSTTITALLVSGGLYNSSVTPMNFVELWSPDRQCSLDPLPVPVEVFESCYMYFNENTNMHL